jgi:hypothetical protein
MSKLTDLTLDENPISFERRAYYQTIIEECHSLQTLDHQQVSKIIEEIGNSKENFAKIEVGDQKSVEGVFKGAENKRTTPYLEELSREDLDTIQIHANADEKYIEYPKREITENLPKSRENNRTQRVLEASSENRKEEKGKSISPIRQKPNPKEKQRLPREDSDNVLEIFRRSPNENSEDSKELNDQGLDPIVVIKIIEEQFMKEIQRVEVRLFIALIDLT